MLPNPPSQPTGDAKDAPLGRGVLPPEQRMAGLPPEQRMAGLSPEQIRQHLDRLTAGRTAAPRKPRRKK